MKNKINNESNTKYINNKEKEKNIYEFKERMNKASNLIEYFAIIGLDPKISTKDFLYELSPSYISKLHSEELKPKLITKYPPINKPYINIDENICELCFPENIIKIEKFKTQPEPIINYFLIGNDFYSIEHPIKYVTCLKFYENLEQYKTLQKRINIEEKNKNKNNSFENDNKDILLFNEEKKVINNNLNKKRNNSQKIKNIKKYISSKENIENNLNNYYLPKVICFISLKSNYKLQANILYQLYNYYKLKKVKIPIEKIVLNILCNIPLPPRGIHAYQYIMSKDFEKIIIKSEKMNKIKNYDRELNMVFHYFNVNTLLEIFKYTLFETKIIAFSTNVNRLCILIHCLISILYPFNFPFQVASCVREDAFEVLESIPPYIIGINQKYEDNFFKKNKIELKSTNFLILDLDNKEYLISSVEDLPDIPKGIFKKLKTRIENNLKKYEKSNQENIEPNDEENLITFAFYEFFLNILINYADFLNKDNLKKNFKISCLNILFKTKEFIDSHSSSERPFYKRLTETQMFNDFIFKKMIPKDLNDKLDLLLFDGNINKINNKKFFKRNKSISFLASKEYDFKSLHKIPKVKELVNEELNKYKNKKYYLKNLYKGQDIIFEKNNYFFNYILFPKFNEDYYNFPSQEFFLYYSTIDSIANDIKRVNTDLLAKSLLNTEGDNNTLLYEGEGMLDYIYLTYIEVWSYAFWYQDLSERDYRFEQLLEVLDKIKRQEIELFNVLFELLNKFHEKEKIRKLYNKILEYRLTPNSFIYSIVGKNIKKDKNIFYEDDIYLGKTEEKINFQRRTFKSEKDMLTLGDNIYFDYIQECPECTKKINIELICKNYKKMEKNLLWAQCPLCLNNIKPQISVIIGDDIFPGKNNSFLTKREFFTIYSPYELKNNIKFVVDREQFHFLNVDKLRMNFPNVFWNCIWYFHLYKLDYSIILPYEVNIYKKTALNSEINTPFIITKFCPFVSRKNSNDDEKNNDKGINIKNEIIVKDKKKELIIHNIYSFQFLARNRKRSITDFFDSIENNKKV